MQALIDWINEVGGYVHPALAHKQLNRYNKGVVLEEDVPYDAEKPLLFHIPADYCMSEASFAASYPEINARLELPAERAGLLKNLRLVLFLQLEMEKGESSKYWPYLRQLPRLKDYDYHPIVQYRPECKERWLKINEVATLSIENHRTIAGMLFEEAQKYVESCTEEGCLWFYLVLLTRQWGGFGLVPFADNIQHSNKSTMYLSTIDEGKESQRPGFKIPVDGLKKGDQLFDNYGIGDETITYTSFGFIDEPHNDKLIRYYRVTLSNSMTVGNGLDNFKEAELRRIFKDQKNFYITNNTLHPTILEYLRIINLSAADMRLIDPTKEYWKSIISLGNEGAVHLQLLGLIKKGQLVVPKEDIAHARKVMKKYKANTVEWCLARLLVIRQEVVAGTVEKLINGWVNQLQIPFPYSINVEL